MDAAPNQRIWTPPPCPRSRSASAPASAPEQIIERLDAVAPRTIRGRTRTPALIRNHATMEVDGPVHERWKLGYLIDSIYLRDLWMHRIDAVGHPN